MKSLDFSQEDLAKTFEVLDGFDSQGLQKFLADEPGQKGLHFFKVEYDDGEIVLPKGVYSEYAALVLEGRIRVQDIGLAPARNLPRLPACWLRARPWLRRIMDRLREMLPADAQGWRGWLRRLLRRREHDLAFPTAAGYLETEVNPADPVISARDDSGKLNPLLDRLIGVMAVTWNQKRTGTLTAYSDSQNPHQKCQVLLIKRRALLTIVDPETHKPFYDSELQEFLNDSLPLYLAYNRLFRNTVYVEELTDDIQWAHLLAMLRGTHRGKAGFGLENITDYCDPDFLDFARTLSANHLDGTQKYQIISRLNDILKREDLPVEVDGNSGLEPELTQLLTQFNQGKVTKNQRFRLNRLLFEAAFPDVLRKSNPFHPLSLDDFREFVKRMQAEANGVLQPEEYEASIKKPVQLKPDHDALYFILAGRLRVTRETSGEFLNNLAEYGYFGAPVDPKTRIVATTRTMLLKVPLRTIDALAARFPEFETKLKREAVRMRSREADLESGRRIAPADPPPEIAERLSVATNLLLIDMDRCTRCDQCVSACAAAHEDIPRFHRSNPELSWGKWEVAGACVHCVDAPCQNACPVGAITIRDDDTRAVQIHRNRCIGCVACARACPFNVIEMLLPADKMQQATGATDRQDSRRSSDAPMLNLPKLAHVANKCDLCLTIGSDPPCVVACPYGAAQRGPPQTLFEDFKGRAIFVLPISDNTRAAAN